MDKNVKMMDDLMNAIIQTDMWMTEQKQNPQVLKADQQLNAELQGIRGMVPDEVYHRIVDATHEYAAAFEHAAILYGIHVADAIHDVAGRPSDLSRHILARVQAATREVTA